MANPNMIVCFAAPLTAFALLLTAVCFATDNWWVTTVNRQELIGFIDNKTLDSSPIYVTRYRGLFRTCFKSQDAYFLEKAEYKDDITDKTCLKDRGLEMSPGVPWSNLGNSYETRGHLLRLQISCLAISMFLLLISAFLGGFGCLKKRAKFLYSTAILNTIAGFMTAAGVALFHGVNHFEQNEIVYETFPKKWKLDKPLAMNSVEDLGFSYIVGWVGCGFAFAAAILFFWAGSSVKSVKKEQKKPYMMQHPVAQPPALNPYPTMGPPPQPHPMDPQFNMGYEPDPRGYPYPPPSMMGGYYAPY